MCSGLPWHHCLLIPHGEDCTVFTTFSCALRCIHDFVLDLSRLFGLALRPSRSWPLMPPENLACWSLALFVFPIVGNSICDATRFSPRPVIEHSPEFPHVRVENDSNELSVEWRQLMHACDTFSVFPCCVVSFLATDHLEPVTRSRKHSLKGGNRLMMDQNMTPVRTIYRRVVTLQNQQNY